MMKKADIFHKVTEWFSANMERAESELHYDSPFHLLIAVILSAQCTDKRVNMHTPIIFERFPEPSDLAEASFEEVYRVIEIESEDAGHYDDEEAESETEQGNTLADIPTTVIKQEKPTPQQEQPTTFEEPQQEETQELVTETETLEQVTLEVPNFLSQTPSTEPPTEAKTEPPQASVDNLLSGLIPVIDETISVGDKEWKMTCVSMGNPHAVVFKDRVADMDIAAIGPKFENHERFPNRTNTEFVEVLDRDTCFMRVWERGTGETLACGTGCCATAVACILNGLTDDEVTVHVLGGKIKIFWDRESNLVYMTGPAETVFEGEI